MNGSCLIFVEGVLVFR